MNDNKLNKEIIELRRKGYGYKRIAKKLNMTISAVRYSITKIEDEDLIGICKNCSSETRSIRGKKKKTFCSDKCRWDWWNNKRLSSNRINGKRKWKRDLI